MKVNLCHNIEIKTFDDVAQHLFLEAKVMDIKNSSKTYVAETSSIEKKWNKKFKRNVFNRGEGSFSVKFKRIWKVQN